MVFFFFFFGEMTDSGATYVVAHFVQLLCKETHITPPQDCPQYVSGEDFLCLLNVGGTVLSSAALIYVYMSPEESAVCLLPLPVSVRVCVYVCVCGVSWSRNQVCHNQGGIHFLSNRICSAGNT